MIPLNSEGGAPSGGSYTTGWQLFVCLFFFFFSSPICPQFPRKNFHLFQFLFSWLQTGNQLRKRLRLQGLPYDPSGNLAIGPLKLSPE